MRHVSPEFDFGQTPARNKYVLLEGLSVHRAQYIADRALKHGNIAVPSMGTLRNERKIKSLAFDCRYEQRDPMAECMITLGLRRAVLTAAIANNRRSTDRPVLLRLHLLSSYSALRDDRISLNNWVNMVENTFGDDLPSGLIMLDHRLRGGKVDLDQIKSTHRDHTRLSRDCSRRYDAIRALVEAFNMDVINLAAGVHPMKETQKAIAFINRSVTQ